MSLDYEQTYQWYYYPLMQSNEMLLFKQYDSGEGADNFIPVFHTAFNIIPDANYLNSPRQSIEVRFLVGHD